MKNSYQVVEDIKEGKFTRYSELLIQYGRFMQHYMGVEKNLAR